MSALQELRQSAQALLDVSENSNNCPTDEIETYLAVFQKCQARLVGFSSHFGGNREDAEWFEQKILPTLDELTKAMKPVTLARDNQDSKFPIAKEIIQPARKVLEHVWSAEFALFAVSATPEELQMPIEDRRASGLILLLRLAQAYYTMLENVIGTGVGQLDMELNQSYFWVTDGIAKLLSNHEDLKDFPGKFEPVLPDLYPTTVRDLDWDEMIAPRAEGFLCTVQRYVQEKRVHRPEEQSVAWTFLELYRPSVEAAIERAVAYGKRMRKLRDRIMERAEEYGRAQERTSAAGASNELDDSEATDEAAVAAGASTEQQHNSDSRPIGVTSIQKVDIGMPTPADTARRTGISGTFRTFARQPVSSRTCWRM